MDQHETVRMWRELCKLVDRKEDCFADFAERISKLFEFLNPISAEDEY